MGGHSHNRTDKGERWLAEQERRTFMALEHLAGAPCYDSFDEYVAAHPEGESFRAWVTSSGRNKHVKLIPGAGPHSGLPGEYLHAHLVHSDECMWISVRDCDDGYITKVVDDKEEGLQELENLKKLAPFHLWELEEFGYKH
jgi:hypothetical protein